MNYEKIYDNLIQFRQQCPVIEGYSEKHHIIPKSLGGPNTSSNLVRLTARDHCIAHLLLAKFNPCKEMIYALWAMQWSSNKQKRHTVKRTSRMYAWAKTKFIEYNAELTRNRIVSDSTRKKMSKSQRGRVITDDTKQRMRDSWTSRQPFSDEHRENLKTAAQNRKPFPSDHRQKISASLTGRTLSDEHRRNKSIAQIGRVVTEETRQRIRESLAKTRAAKKLNNI